MSDKLDIGNQAEWEGASLEKLEGINSGNVYPQPDTEIDVDVAIMGNDLEVMPKYPKYHLLNIPGAIEGVRLSEGPDAALNAQLVEEPEEYATSLVPAGLRSIAQGDDPKARNRGCLIHYGIAPNYTAAVTGDRVLIEKDGVESEWACRTCNGKGHLDEACPACSGTLSSGGGVCRECTVIGFGVETAHSCGHRVCPDCSSRGIGTGWKGRIIIPEKAQDIPMTGHVVSVGPQTLLAQLGDRVLFSKYSGHNINNQFGSYQIMRESEILCILKEKK